MNNYQSNNLLEMILEEIQLPDYIYEQAKKRYEDIGLWLENYPNTQCFSPTVFPQGSFRLGTAVKPVGREEFDLDLVCNIQSGILKEMNTQKDLKELVGNALMSYNKEKDIKDKLIEKRRGWRLVYADKLKFHMDILPCTPDITTIIPDSKFDKHLVSITDNQSTCYSVKVNKWLVSNPEGFAQWFESRVKTNLIFGLDTHVFNDLPRYRWKTPLQKSIQLLKRHRDVMFFDNQDLKPISIIITTLAANIYQSESDVATAITNILEGMINSDSISKSYVPNPVNPEENFADKWGSTPELRENFERWLIQARADIHAICSQDNRQIIIDSINNGFGLPSESCKNFVFGFVPIRSTTNIMTDSSKLWLEKLKLTNSHDIIEFLALRPKLRLTNFTYNKIAIEGDFDIDTEINGFETIKDTYKLRITLTDNFPREIPIVYELEGKIPKNEDFHVNSDGSLCIGSRIRLKFILHQSPSLENFAKRILEPHLYSISYRQQNGCFPVGELKHGVAGLIQDYEDLFNVEGKYAVLSVLEILGSKEQDANKLCPCGCLNRLGKCDFRFSLETLRKLESRKWYRKHHSLLQSGS